MPGGERSPGMSRARLERALRGGANKSGCAWSFGAGKAKEKGPGPQTGVWAVLDTPCWQWRVVGAMGTFQILLWIPQSHLQLNIPGASQLCLPKSVSSVPCSWDSGYLPDGLCFSSQLIDASPYQKKPQTQSCCSTRTGSKAPARHPGCSEEFPLSLP